MIEDDLADMKNKFKSNVLRVLFSFFLVAVLLPACGGQGASKGAEAVQKNTSSAKDDETTKAGNRQSIVVGVDAKTMPMVFWDNKTNTLIGYDIDLAKEAFARAGLQYEFKPIDWDKKEDDLLKKQNIDAIWSSLTISESRKKIFAFSSPYIKNKKSILVRADSSIRTKSDLGGKVVAVQVKSNSAEVVRNISGKEAPAKVTEFAQRPDTFVAVLAGQADAAVTDSVIIDYYAANSPGKFRVLQDNLQEEEFGVAVRPTDTGLLEKINQSLASMQADGTSQAIYRRWFGEGQ